MRKVERIEPAPDRLLEKGATELIKATDYFGPPRESASSFDFKAYKLDEVKRALERLFQGKCAYCETFYSSTQPMDVEHYRPKGAVFEDKDHPGYWWLAMSWENLLPSCIDCNRKRYQLTPLDDGRQANVAELERVGSGKKDSFPIVDTNSRAKTTDAAALTGEKPLLLNPCADDPDLHLKFYFVDQYPVSFVTPRELNDDFDGDYRDVEGLSRKGRASIDVYGLNRLGLVQARSEILRRLVFLEAVVVDLSSISQDMKDRQEEHELLKTSSKILLSLVDDIIKEMARMADPGAPYSRMVSAWLDGFEERYSN